MLKVGTEILLEINHQDEPEKYRSKIADFDDGRVYIHYPINLETNKTAFISSGTKMFASIIGQESNVYLFETLVIDRIKKHVPMIVISYPGEEKLMKIQRRQFVRIQTAVDIALQFADSKLHFTTTTDDFSAGGCAAIIPPHINIKAGEIGSLYIVMLMQKGEYIYLLIECRVVRIFEKNKLRLASLQFVNVDNQQQQQLTRFCFERQLEYRKRGITD